MSKPPLEMTDDDFMQAFSNASVLASPLGAPREFTATGPPEPEVVMLPMLGSDCTRCGCRVYSHSPLGEIGGHCMARTQRSGSLCDCPGYMPEWQPKEFCGWDPEMGSICVVAANSSEEGVVLFWDGADLDWEIHEMSTKFEDLSFDDAPPEGIHVWEGRTRGWKHWTDCGYEYESELRGEFREPTAREWHLIEVGLKPWEERRYWKKGPIPVDIANKNVVDFK